MGDGATQTRAKDTACYGGWRKILDRVEVVTEREKKIKNTEHVPGKILGLSILSQDTRTRENRCAHYKMQYWDIAITYYFI